MNLLNFRLQMTFIFIFVCSLSVQASELTETHTYSNTIFVPVFDTTLGTLTGVTFEVTLESDWTASSNPHSHTLEALDGLDTNGHTLSPYDSAFGGEHNHTVLLPVYSSHGLTIPAVSFSTDLAGVHLHSITPPPLGGTGSSGTLSGFEAGSASAHDHSMAAQARSFTFSNGDLDLFLGELDFMINTGFLLTSSEGAHTHPITPPAEMLGTGSSGTLGPFMASASSDHAHLIAPTWTTTTTFYFNPIPEPSSLMLLGFGLLGVCGWVHKERMQQTD